MAACERYLHVMGLARPRHGIACRPGARQLVRRADVEGGGRVLPWECAACPACVVGYDLCSVSCGMLTVALRGLYGSSPERARLERL